MCTVYSIAFFDQNEEVKFVGSPRAGMDTHAPQAVIRCPTSSQSPTPLFAKPKHHEGKRYFRHISPTKGLLPNLRQQPESNSDTTGQQKATQPQTTPASALDQQRPPSPKPME